jgi:hypothetical protein
LVGQGNRAALSLSLEPQLVGRRDIEGRRSILQMDKWHKTMIARSFDFNFTADWRKDLAICLDGARRNGPPR